MSIRTALTFVSTLSLLTMTSMAQAEDTASFAINTTVKFNSDVRNRGISDSLQEPGVRANLQLAHESGVVGFVELSTVSTKQFLNSSGQSVLTGLGWRTGNPDGWHFGVGAAAELFPGASYEAPHALDVNTFTTSDNRRTKYDSTLLLLEAGYGALDMRVMTVVSDTYRGIDTGGVCGTLLQLNADPMVGANCYARGDQNSRGSWLLDLDYKIPVTAQTTVTLHAGYQRVANFKEADMDDYGIGITHKRWGFDFTAEWLTAQTRARELYLVQDGGSLRATDNEKVVLTISRTF